MKYNCKNYIRVFYDTWGGEKSPEISTSIETVDIAKNNQFIKQLIIEVFKKSTRGDARNFLKTGSINNEPIANTQEALGKDTKTRIAILKNWIEGAGIYDPEGSISGNLSHETVSSILESLGLKEDNDFKGELEKTVDDIIKKRGTQVKDQTTKQETQKPWKVKNQFTEKYGEIDVFINTVLSPNGIINHPIILMNKLQLVREDAMVYEKKYAELKGKPENSPFQKYIAVIDTVLELSKTDDFRKNTGMGDTIRRGYKAVDYVEWLRGILKTAKEKQSPQIVEYKRALDEKVGEIIEKSPPELFNKAFLAFLEARYNGGDLNQETVKKYVNDLGEGIDTLLLKIPASNTAIREKYENTKAQIKAMAEQDVLYSTGSASFFAFFTGKKNTFDDFLKVARSGEGLQGGIGKDDAGGFKFYTTEALKSAIIYKGENGLEKEQEGVAWNSYIKSVGGDIGKLETIFGSEFMAPLAIYLKNRNFDSAILSGLTPEQTENLKQGLDTVIDTSKKSTSEKLGSKLNGIDNKEFQELTLFDFPIFSKLLNKYGLSLPKIPLGEDGRPSATLMAIEVRGLSRAQGKPIEFAKLVKAAIDDLASLSERLKSQDIALTNELPSHLRDWGALLKELEIKEVYDKEGKIMPIGGNIDKIEIINEEHRTIVVNKLAAKKLELEKNPDVNKEMIVYLDIIIEKLRLKGQSKELKVQIAAIGKVKEGAADTANGTGTQVNLAGIVTGASRAEINNKLAKSNANHLSEKISDTTLTTYGLTRADIVNSGNVYDLGKIRGALSMLDKKLQKGEKLSDEENRLYTSLRDIDYVVKEEVRVANEYQEFKQKHPYFGDTFASIEASNPNIGNPKIIEQYQGVIRGSENIATQGIVKFTELQAGMPYSISQIPELSRLNVDTIASTAILSIDKKTGTYTITDKENRYNPIKDIKEQELAQKLQDANTLAEMKAYCLIPQIELMRTLIGQNSRLQGLTGAGENGSQKEVQLISAVELLLGKESVEGQPIVDRKKAVYMDTNSDAIYRKLVARGVFSDGGTLRYEVVRGIVLEKPIRVENMTDSELIDTFIGTEQKSKILTLPVEERKSKIMEIQKLVTNLRERYGEINSQTLEQYRATLSNGLKSEISNA